jgi:transposase-like protein
MTLLKIYTDEEAAREHLEALNWPDGPICPRCGAVNEATKLEGKSTRPGVYKCRPCEKPFTVTVGTVFERSKIKLNAWVHAVDLYTASKKGFSAHQLHRTLGVTYKTAWFMAHRIREAMRDPDPTPMGGSGKVVESDETYIGKLEGAPTGRRKPGPAFRNIVMTLVERDGSARSFHINSTTLNEITKIVRDNVKAETIVNTDEGVWYKQLGAHFLSHDTVNHSQEEYARGDITTNTVEGYYSIFKRGMKGIYQHCSEKHLHRYLAEFDFRYSNRVKLGFTDAMRADKAMKGIVGKRLMYRRPSEKFN